MHRPLPGRQRPAVLKLLQGQLRDPSVVYCLRYFWIFSCILFALMKFLTLEIEVTCSWTCYIYLTGYNSKLLQLRNPCGTTWCNWIAKISLVVSEFIIPTYAYYFLEMGMTGTSLSSIVDTTRMCSKAVPCVQKADAMYETVPHSTNNGEEKKVSVSKKLKSWKVISSLRATSKGFETILFTVSHIVRNVHCIAATVSYRNWTARQTSGARRINRAT